MTETRQYRPIKVVGTFVCPLGTVDILDGAVRDQDFVTFARTNDDWDLESDGAGNATRVGNDNETAELTVNISASSPTNDKLTKIRNLDKASGTGVGILELEDTNGTSKIIMRGCFIARVPDRTFGAQRGMLAWRFKAAKGDHIAGGHDLA
jgi:hypothetical protein